MNKAENSSDDLAAVFHPSPALGISAVRAIWSQQQTGVAAAGGGSRESAQGVRVPLVTRFVSIEL